MNSVLMSMKQAKQNCYINNLNPKHSKDLGCVLSSSSIASSTLMAN